jgi:hypothetical protein
MTSPPTGYPDSWRPRGAPAPEPQAQSSPAPVEALELALDAYVASLTDTEFAALVERTRGPQ